jgi:ABC-type Fe3+-hydroxamate transport system substrate-binding protein
LPKLTSQRVTSADLAAIDREVSHQLQEGESLYRLEEQLLRDLRPDLIITQDLCEVCSIDLKTVSRVAASMSPSPRVLSLNPATIEDVLDDVLKIGAAIGLEGAAQEEMVALRARLYAAEEYVNPYADGPVVGFLEWTDPLFCAGHWTVQLIERAGGRHPLNHTKAREGAGAGAQHGQRIAGRSIRVTDEKLEAARPDYLVICPCGLSLEQTRKAAQDLSRRAIWSRLPAVERGRVALVDGNQMFNRPGPRLVDAFEWLVGWLNDLPSLIPAGFPWEPMS